VVVKEGRREDGSGIVVEPEGKSSRPTTGWNEKRQEAGAHGTGMWRALLPGRQFPFPKSLYAVEDCLRLFVGDKPDAVILDFFSGSGTTAHAVMRLNRQDGGRRQCVSITNNEVAADEHSALLVAGLRPGDRDWERRGICDQITGPRIEAAITGRTPEGKTVEGEYKFIDGFPIAEGFEENAEFFELTYETPVAVNHNIAFERIAPLLWLRAGAEGARIDAVPDGGWEVVRRYGILVDLDQSIAFFKAIGAEGCARVAYVVTDDDRRFQSVARSLPMGVEPVRLYESYLSNFRFSIGN